MKKKSHVSERKIKAVKRLAEEMKKSRAIIIVSIKNVPSQQFQKIKKNLRGKAKLNVVKKSILTRAIDETGIPELAGLKEHVLSDCALVLSDEEAFELASWMAENKNPISAKQGQTADDDIKIDVGPTSLLPGPAISELSSVGLKVSVEEGKIAIKQPKVVVKKGEKVSAEVASVLQKLDIKPFMIGLNPAVIYDSKDKKIYINVRIDKKQTLAYLLSSHAKALGFAQAVRYYCRDIIGHLLAKANAEACALGRLAPKEKQKTETQSKPEEKKNE